MAELGAGAGTDYPTGLDTDNSQESSSTVARADVPNDLASAIIAVQTELGLSPSGSLATVLARFEVTQNADGTIDFSKANHDHSTDALGGRAVPAGSVTAFAGKTAPTGWLECDGSSQEQSAYTDLYTALDNGAGTGIYGEVDGTHFNLPDLRGQFVRGYDHGAGTDPNAGTRTDAGDGVTTGDNVGTKQADAFKSHTHTASLKRSNGTNDLSSNFGSYTDEDARGTDTTNATGGSETRPTNVYMMYIIKT